MNSAAEFKQHALAWEKMGGLVPVIVQDAATGAVLMLGYMNQEALEKTLEDKVVTFYSRSKQRLWTKGEISKNYLALVDIVSDCDNDALLVVAKPMGPTCHTGTQSCFGDTALTSWQCIKELEALLLQRYQQRPAHSYASELFNRGINKVAQKVGEEAVETVIAAINESDEALAHEAADLLFHLLLLLTARNVSLDHIISVLKSRK